jgi:hypothetical protein
MTDEQIIEKYDALFAKMPPDMGASLIQKNLMQQRRKYKGKRKDYDRDMCSLIDLQKGLIVGSGICPACRGWLGRADAYDD